MFKRLSIMFFIISAVLSNIMCAVVAYNYRAMICGIDHMGYSAPASSAFIYAIPFFAGIVVCIILAVVFKKKAKI